MGHTRSCSDSTGHHEIKVWHVTNDCFLVGERTYLSKWVTEEVEMTLQGDKNQCMLFGSVEQMGLFRPA